MSFSALGVVPARGGSKGVPRKNIREVAGEPLIAYAIRAAQASKLLTAYLTTTDDDEIAGVARCHGSPVIRRPAELGQDDTEIIPVLLHALELAERDIGDVYDAVVLLQPTAPIRTGQDVDAVIQMLADDPGIDSVVSVCRAEDAHPARMYRVGTEGILEPVLPELERALRQELPSLYHRNGALYACRRQLLVDRHMIMGDSKKAYIMPLTMSANIDNEVDLLVADVMVKRWKEGML